MPYNYAHYRFGAAMLEVMPGDIRQTVKRYRRLYDLGLHGPDIFFYCNLLNRTRYGSLGSRIHRQTGKEFFGRVCRPLRLEPSREAEAYLYGLLCHYVLDSICHPFILEQDKQGIAEHIGLETEFDRFLLELDGKHPPETQDISNHMQLTPKECATVARFYPGITDKVIAAGVRNMAWATKTLATGNGAARELMKKGLGLVSGKFQGFVMTEGPNPQCSSLDEPLFALYQEAEEKFPDMLMQLSAHLTYNAPLEGAFLNIFG